MDGLLGWNEGENTDSAALWIKMFTVWKNIKGRDLEKSVCGLVSDPECPLGCCYFSKSDSKSLIMCLQTHCGFTKMRQIFLKLCPLHRRQCLENLLALKEGTVLPDAKVHLAYNLRTLLE